MHTIRIDMLAYMCYIIVHILSAQFLCITYHHCTGTVLEGPSNVTYLPGLTMLPIELICNVTGIPIWRINSSVYLPADLFNGVLAGHNSSGTDILVNSPVNNTKYVCVSQTINGNINSNPAYIIVAGKSDEY